MGSICLKLIFASLPAFSFSLKASASSFFNFLTFRIAADIAYCSPGIRLDISSFL